MPEPVTIWPAAVSERSTALVGGPARPALVIAAFPSALYLVLEPPTGPGTTPGVAPLLPVVARGGLRLPTAVTLATAVPGRGWGVTEGASVVVGEGSIRLPSAVVAGVRTWRPRRMPSAATPLTREARSAVSSLAHGPLRDEALDLALDVRRRRHVTARVGALIGAGPGLTPRGDDVVCGVLLGLQLLGPRSAALAASLWEAVVPRLGATTSLSAALLAEAAQGYAAPSVIQLGEALVAGDVPRVLATGEDVATIGHTSGRDLLAGLAGCLEAFEIAEIPRESVAPSPHDLTATLQGAPRD